MRIFSILLVSIVLIFTVSSCERREKQDVLMVYPNWAEGISITYLAKTILEDKGYKVALKRLEPGPIYASLSRGDADIYIAAWLPYTHEYYWSRFHKRLDELGYVFDDGTTGLVVPNYVPINTIQELNDHQSEFGSKIYGIAAGAGIHKNTEIAIEKYGLKYDQISSSETSMITVLKRAVAQKEWVVVTGWKPHFMWSDFDIKILDDPNKVFPIDTLKIISRKDFAKDKPELASFFNNLNSMKRCWAN